MGTPGSAGVTSMAWLEVGSAEHRRGEPGSPVSLIKLVCYIFFGSIDRRMHITVPCPGGTIRQSQPQNLFWGPVLRPITGKSARKIYWHSATPRHIVRTRIGSHIGRFKPAGRLILPGKIQSGNAYLLRPNVKVQSQMLTFNHTIIIHNSQLLIAIEGVELNTIKVYSTTPWRE